jgi:Tfp pilus assembly protein PilN
VSRRINLVPRSERARTTTNVGALVLLAAAVLVLFGLGLGYYLLSSSRSDATERLDILKEERATLQSQVAALSAYQQLASQRSSTETVIQGIYAGRTLVADVLNDLSLAVPENVWFTELDLQTLDPAAALGLVGGQSTSASTATENALTVLGDTYTFPDVALLLVRLRLVESIADIDLDYAGDPVGPVDETKEVHGFSINAKVNNTQAEDTPLPLSKVEVEGL